MVIDLPWQKRWAQLLFGAQYLYTWSLLDNVHNT